MKKEAEHTEEGPSLRFFEEKMREQLSQKSAEELIRSLRLLSPWSWDIEIVPKRRRSFYDHITFTVLFSFLASFSVGRTVAYLVTFHYIPNIFLNVRGVHVHHFIYGIVVLAVAGFLSLLSFSPRNKIWLSLLYGVGLGLAADEAGQWLRLQDNYWVRQSYDALIITSLILLIIIYLPRYLGIFYRRYKVGERSNKPKHRASGGQELSPLDAKVGSNKKRSE